MPKIEAVLKEEITRLARKEIKAELETLKKSSAHYRAQISELKVRCTALERENAKLQKHLGKPTRTAPEAEEKKFRFRAQGFANLRKRLGLSAADLGLLIGVSPQTIYHWESGKTRPRASQLKEVAAVRHLGKREVLARLASCEKKDNLPNQE